MTNRNEDSDGMVAAHAQGLGTVTAEMVTKRAQEIAFINRRTDNKPTPEDWQEAKLELTSGTTGHDPMDDLPVSKRWDPVPGSTAHQAKVRPPEDEQSAAEVLVQSGVEEADHEHMVEGTRESIRHDRELGDSGT